MTDEIVRKIIEIVARECDLPVDLISLDTTFETLGLDSLDLLSLLAEIRQTVGPVSDSFISRLENVGDLAAAVGASVEKV